MTNLLRKPTGTSGKVHAIGPAEAGWTYVGFDCWRLAPGAVAEDRLPEDREAILVMVEGKARVSGAGQDWGEIGDRLDVFEKTPPHALYLPAGSEWRAEATTACVIAVCTAPGGASRPAQRLGPGGIVAATRGKGANERHIFNVAMEDRDVADSLLVTEVFTPQGNWSSYPPHRHDVDDFPNITLLEESYYFRLNPSQGYGHQRVFTEDGTLDVTMSPESHDVTLVPKGHHPCAAPYGYEMYYLNVMAGPLRKWRFRNHPDHDWIAKRDA